MTTAWQSLPDLGHISWHQPMRAPSVVMGPAMVITAPPRRTVRVHRDQYGRWAWDCTRCHPPVHGSTSTWARTMANVTRHYRHRAQHHAYVDAHPPAPPGWQPFVPPPRPAL